MNQIIKFSRINVLLGVIVTAMLFSFSGLPGAHSFQVYLDSKLVIDRYVNSNMEIPVLLISPDENHRLLIVKYNECGRTVTGRTITIKDESNNELKKWHFEGAATGFDEPMVLSFAEVTKLKQKGRTILKVYYSSRDFAGGQQIATLTIGREGTTAKK